MAATIAKAIGHDSGRSKETHRLGSQSSQVHANTWRTFTTAIVNRDGSGYVEVRRDNRILHTFEFGPEGDEN
jgi:hypothetical protein